MRSLLAVLIAGLAPAFLLLTAGTADPVHADVSGPCFGYVDSPAGGRQKNANDIDTPGSAFEASSDEALVVGMGLNEGVQDTFTSHRVQLEFVGFRWTVADDEDSGNDSSWTDTVSVDDYASFGAGLYKAVVHAELASGAECDGVAYFDVDGSPFTTIAGIVALVASILGAVGLLFTGLISFNRGGDGPGGMGCCSLFVFPALLLTGLAMAPGGGTVPTAPPPAGRGSVRPRISVVALISGLLLAIGIVVLLQEFSVLYPTRVVAIVGIVAGLALGVIIPNLAQMLSAGRSSTKMPKQEPPPPGEPGA